MVAVATASIFIAIEPVAIGDSRCHALGRAVQKLPTYSMEGFHDQISRPLVRKSEPIVSIMVTPDTTVYDAIALMARKRVGAVLVIGKERLVGIVTERDYARKVILQGRSSKEIVAGDIMTEDLVIVTPESTVDDCMRIMTHHRVRHLPVLDGGRLVGIVSIGDLVKSVIADQALTIDQLHTYIGGKYPG